MVIASRSHDLAKFVLEHVSRRAQGSDSLLVRIERGEIYAQRRRACRFDLFAQRFDLRERALGVVSVAGFVGWLGRFLRGLLIRLFILCQLELVGFLAVGLV